LLAAVVIAIHVKLFYRTAVFSIELNCWKGVDLDPGDVIGSDVNLRHDDVIAVGVELGKLVPYWSEPLTVNTPRSI